MAEGQGVSPAEAVAEEEDCDESLPLSPNRVTVSVDTATPEGAAENLDEVDPFTYHPPFSLWHKILVVINALWLFPLRLIFIVIPSVIVGTFVCASSTFCERFDPENPTPRARWRKVYADTLVPLVARIFLFGFGFNWIHYKGRPASTQEAPIIVLAPHSSLLDVFVVSLYGIPSFVAKEDMQRIIFFGRIITSMRTIFVKRDDPQSRMKAAEAIQERASSGGRWSKVLLFPEGTTHNRKMLLTFKKGAFLPKLPVQPFLIRYNNRINTTTWGRSGRNMILSLFYTLCQFHNSLEVEFLDVYVPSEAEKADAQLYTRNVQTHLSKSLGIPAGNQCIEDYYFMTLAWKIGLPFPSGLVLYNRLTRETGIKFEEIRDFLLRFAAIDADKDGWVTPQDMATFLSVPNDAHLQALFWSTEKASGERLSFKQYLYGFVGRAKPFLADSEFLQSTFAYFDQDGDGSVSMSDISGVLPVTKLPQVTSSQVVRRRRGIPDNPSPPKSWGVLEDEGEDEEKLDFDAFQSMLKGNPEYLLLFREHQNARLSPPPTGPTPSSNQAHHQWKGAESAEPTKVTIEVREA